MGTVSNQIINLSTSDQLMGFYRNCTGEEFADPALTPNIHAVYKKILNIATSVLHEDVESSAPFPFNGGCGAKSNNNVTVGVDKNKFVISSSIDDPISINLHLSPSQIQYEIRNRDASGLHKHVVSAFLREEQELTDVSSISYVCLNQKDLDDCYFAGMGGLKVRPEDIANLFEGHLELAKERLEKRKETDKANQGNGPSPTVVLGGVALAAAGIGLGLYVRHKSHQKKEAEKTNGPNSKNTKPNASLSNPHRNISSQHLSR